MKIFNNDSKSNKNTILALNTVLLDLNKNETILWNKFLLFLYSEKQD